MEDYACPCINAGGGDDLVSPDPDIGQRCQLCARPHRLISFCSAAGSRAPCHPGVPIRRVCRLFGDARRACIPGRPGQGGLRGVVHDAVVAAAGSCVAGAGAVAAEHLRGGPPIQFHEVALGAAAVEPGMAEVMPEPVRGDPGAALASPPGDDLAEAACGQRAAVTDAEPELRPVSLHLPGADPYVPVEGTSGVVAELDSPGLAAGSVDGDVAPLAAHA